MNEIFYPYVQKRLIFNGFVFLDLSECWKQRNGDYVKEGHGEVDECYPTLDEAKTKCIAAGDCKAIATQSNVCDGKFRVSHGGPTFVEYENWQSINLKSYEYLCSKGK